MYCDIEPFKICHDESLNDLNANLNFSIEILKK